MLDTASPSRSLNNDNEEKQRCFHQTATLFRFYQFVLFSDVKKKPSCWVLTAQGPGSQLVWRDFAMTAFKVKKDARVNCFHIFSNQWVILEFSSVCVWDVCVCQTDAQTDTRYTWKEELKPFTVHYLTDSMSTSLIPLTHVDSRPGGADRSLHLQYVGRSRSNHTFHILKLWLMSHQHARFFTSHIHLPLGQ